ncbi:hypothetical protein E4U58_001394 [Claviceps cyperi]|nr:hypothetical protein E4U58_001394 [Claviceps cyperi]
MSQTGQQDDHHIDNVLISAFDNLSIAPISSPSAPPVHAMANTSTTGTTAPATVAPHHLYVGYPNWDGNPDSFENWLVSVDIPLRDPGMAAFLGSPAHICGALFARIPSARQSECSEYIRSRQRSRFADVDTDAPQPFVVDHFIKSLITAFMPKDLAARAWKQIYCIRQGPAQPPPMSDGLLSDDEAPMYAVEHILRAGPWKWTRGMLVEWAGLPRKAAIPGSRIGISTVTSQFSKLSGLPSQFGYPTYK